MDYLLLSLTIIVLVISTVMLLSKVVKSRKALKKYDSIINIENEVKRLENLSIKIDKDIEELFDDDVLFTDIKRETLYMNNKFDKLLNDIDHMKNTVENIKNHNGIIYTKTEYYNID